MENLLNPHEYHREEIRMKLYLQFEQAALEMQNGDPGVVCSQSSEQLDAP